MHVREHGAFFPGGGEERFKVDEKPGLCKEVECSGLAWPEGRDVCAEDGVDGLGKDGDGNGEGLRKGDLGPEESAPGQGFDAETGLVRVDLERLCLRLLLEPGDALALSVPVDVGAGSACGDHKVAGKGCGGGLDDQLHDLHVCGHKAEAGRCFGRGELERVLRVERVELEARADDRVEVGQVVVDSVHVCLIQVDGAGAGVFCVC